MYGGTDSDIMVGGPGDDHMWGGSGEGDTFRFFTYYAEGPGSDTIHDFTPGQDVLDFHLVGTRPASMDDIDLIAADGHGNTVIEEGDVHVTLLGVCPEWLSESDFIF